MERSHHHCFLNTSVLFLLQVIMSPAEKDSFWDNMVLFCRCVPCFLSTAASCFLRMDIVASSMLKTPGWRALNGCFDLQFVIILLLSDFSSQTHIHNPPDNCYKPVSSRALAVSSSNCSNKIRPVFSISSSQSRVWVFSLQKCFYATRYNNLAFNFFISQTVIKKWCFSLACVFSLILLQKRNHISCLAGLCFLSFLCLITTWHSQHFSPTLMDICHRLTPLQRAVCFLEMSSADFVHF